MNWLIVTVGKPALPWARDAVADYLSRVGRHRQVECLHLKDAPAEALTKRMLEVSEHSRRILLDERGKQWRSTDLAKWIGDQELAGTKRISLLIGGASGHPPALKEAVKESWSLSSLTLQHEMALALLLEQLYRAYSILQGSPYHRE